MTVITSSPTQFGKLLQIQADNLEELQSVRKVLELSQQQQREAQVQTIASGAGGGGEQKIQIDILGQIKEHVKLSRTYYKSQAEFEVEWRKEAADIAEMTKGMKTFKTLGEKLKDKAAGAKEGMSLGNLKTGLLKSLNVGGIFDKTLAKDAFVKQQKALGSGASDKELAADFEKHNEALKASNKNEAEIAKVKKAAAAGGPEVSDEYLRQKNPEFAAMLEKRREHADVLSTYNRAYDTAAPGGEHVRRLDDRGGNAAFAALQPIPSSGGNKSTTQTAAEETQNAESKEEGLKAVQGQTDLLTKIEANTRGASPDQKAKPIKEEGKEGGGMLSGLLGGGGGGKALASLKNFGVGLVLVAGSLWVAAKAFQEFGEVAWEDVGKGLVALGGLVVAAMALDKVKGQIIMGAGALMVLGAATWVIGAALGSFSELDWETIGKGMLAVAGLGVIGAIAGTAAPLIATGAVALGLMGGALWVIGEAMQAVGQGFKDMGDGLEKLSQLDGGNLLKVAAGLGALSLAMAAFGAAQAIAGVGNLVSRFLTIGTDSPVEQLIKIGQNGEGVFKAADGLDRISKAMVEFGKIDPKSMEAVNNFPWVRATAFVAAGGAMSVNGTKVYNASKGNADEKAESDGGKGATNTNVVNAPQTTNNNTTQVMNSPIRNQESSQSKYIQSRYAYA